MVCSLTLISEIFFTLFGCLEDKLLIDCHVFKGFNLLGSRSSVKYFRLALLISLLFGLLNFDIAICAFRKVSKPNSGLIYQELVIFSHSLHNSLK